MNINQCSTPIEPDTDYLSDLSPKDKPWDCHKWESGLVGDLYQGTIHDCYAGRIKTCSGVLSFGWATDLETGEMRLKLKACRFCRVRSCPICQWRRSLMWIARFLKALPQITQDYPKARWVFLTLTVKNCPIGKLRKTLTHLNGSWKRLAHRKEFPAIGFARSTEVTKGNDATAHPHFHVLMMVNSSYFKGKNYLSQEQWTELWKSCLQVEYTPIVNVQAVKPNKKFGSDAIRAGVVETFKYSVKPEDMFGTGTEEDKAWLVELTNQLHKTRAIALGGVVRNYLSEHEPEDLLTEEGELDVSDDSFRLLFGWREKINRYAKVKQT